MVRSIFCVGFHNDETNGKISAAEEDGGRDRDRVRFKGYVHHTTKDKPQYFIKSDTRPITSRFTKAPPFDF